MIFNRGVGDDVDVRMTYVTNADKLARCIQWLQGQSTVALDLETGGLFSHVDELATMQLGNPTGALPACWVIDVRLFTAAQLRPIFDVLENDKVIKLGQNIRFEYRWLRQKYGIRLRNVVDTQLAEMVARTGLLNYALAVKRGTKAKKGGADDSGSGRGAYAMTSMGHLARHYLGLEIDKDKSLRLSFAKTAPGTHNKRQLHYAAGDVVYPFWIFEHQRTLLKSRKLMHVFQVECAVLPAIAELEHQGMFLDGTPWVQLYQKAIKARNEAERQLDSVILGMQGDLFGGTNADVRPLYYPGGKKQPVAVNYGSPEHVKQILESYCQSVNWKVEVVTRERRFLELLKVYGQNWLDQLNASRALRGEGPAEDRTWENAPWHCIPEDRYVILTSTAKELLILAKCRKQLPASLVDPLIAYSKADQLITAFGSKWLQKIRPDTGRIHQEINQCITDTGRLSGTPSLMQIPKESEYRKCFKPRPGWRFICADYSQQEPRIMAFASQDPTYLRTYQEHDDLYCRVGEEMLDERPTKGSIERDTMKVVVLSKAYRAGPPKLRDQLTVALAEKIMSGELECPTLEYAYKLDRDFFDSFSAIKAFQDQCSEFAHPETGERVWDDLLNAEVTYIRDPSGRIRFFPPGSTNTYTQAPNMICQGASATMTKLAVVIFQAKLYERGLEDRCFVVNIIHDEILAEAEEAIADECALLLQQSMLIAAEKYCPGLPFEAEFPENSNGVIPFWTKKMPKAA